MSTDNPQDIIENWLEAEPLADGNAECDQLLSLLQTDPSAAALLVDAALLRVALRDAPSSIAQSMSEKPRRFGWRPLAIAASLFIVAAAGILFLLFPRSTQIPAGLSAQTLSGYVLIEGRQQTNIPDGARFQIPAGSAIPLRLNDGSTLTADAASELAIENDVGITRELITLNRGAADFQVLPGPKQFHIQTATGLVQVIGTTFRVAVLPPESPIASQMSVNVTTGTVHIKCGRVEQNLTTGTKQTFIHLSDGRDGTLLTGAIATLSQPDRKITLLGSPPYRVAQRAVITLNGNPASLATLTPHMPVKLILGPTTTEVIAILATSAP